MWVVYGEKTDYMWVRLKFWLIFIGSWVKTDPVSAEHYGKLGTFPYDYNSIHNAEHMPDPSLIYFD